MFLRFEYRNLQIDCLGSVHFGHECLQMLRAMAVSLGSLIRPAADRGGFMSGCAKRSFEKPTFSRTRTIGKAHFRAIAESRFRKTEESRMRSFDSGK